MFFQILVTKYNTRPESSRSSPKNGLGSILRKNGSPKKVPCQMPFVMIVLHFFTAYWHFENGITRFMEDVLLDPHGLPHVLALAVPLLIFWARWVEGLH